MASISRGRIVQTQPKSVNAAGLSRIVGLTCIAGFVSDICVAAMPVTLRSAQWRMGLLQPMGDRGIILLFGLALLALSYAGKRLWSKRIGIVSIVVGVFFLLSCLAFVKDSLALQKATIGNLDTQISKLQSQIQQQSSNPELQNSANREQIEATTRQIDIQVDSFKKEVRTTTVRLGLSAISNLLIMGIALISFGRYCMKTRRAQ